MMRGHIPILKMRLQRKRPKMVFLGDVSRFCADDWQNPGERYGQRWTPDNATVYVEPSDVIERLDLRFLAGCTVSVSGSTEKRAMAMFDACKRAGAGTVAATHVIFAENGRCTSGWTEIYRNG